MGTCPGSPSYDGPYTVPAYDGLTETMNDDVNPVADGRCEHVRITHERTGNTVSGDFRSPSTNTCFYRHSIDGSFYDFPLSAFTGLVTEDPAWPSYETEALQSMWPEIKNQLSSLNFGWELPEVRDLWTTPRSILKAFKRKLKRRESGAGRGLSSAEQAILAYEFGLRPLISDVVALSGFVSKVGKQLKFLFNNEGKPVVSHWSKPLAIPALQTKVTNYSWVLGDSRHTFEASVRKAVYTATMEYVFTLPAGTRNELVAMAVLDGLGINANPQIIWDAIPYSFVVDWVLNFGDFIGQYRVRAIEPRVNIIRFTHSANTVIDVEQYMHYAHNRTGGSGNTKVSKTSISSYYRYPSVPNLYEALQPLGVSTREVALGAILLHQQTRRNNP